MTIRRHCTNCVHGSFELPIAPKSCLVVPGETQTCRSSAAGSADVNQKVWGVQTVMKQSPAIVYLPNQGRLIRVGIPKQRWLAVWIRRNFSIREWL